jgi:hypothetical protein
MFAAFLRQPLPVFFAEAAEGEFLFIYNRVHSLTVLIHYGNGTPGCPFVGDKYSAGFGVKPSGPPAVYTKGRHFFSGTIYIRHL